VIMWIKGQRRNVMYILSAAGAAEQLSGRGTWAS
jgi:hypothetical protein